MTTKGGMLQTLTTMQEIGPSSASRVAAKWDKPVRLAQTYLLRYANLGYLERTNPGKNPAVFQITAKGRSVIDPEAPPYAKPSSCEADAGFHIVAQAVRTQPTSVWDLGRINA